MGLGLGCSLSLGFMESRSLRTQRARGEVEGSIKALLNDVPGGGAGGGRGEGAGLRTLLKP